MSDSKSVVDSVLMKRIERLERRVERLREALRIADKLIPWGAKQVSFKTPIRRSDYPEIEQALEADKDAGKVKL